MDSSLNIYLYGIQIKQTIHCTFNHWFLPLYICDWRGMKLQGTMGTSRERALMPEEHVLLPRIPLLMAQDSFTKLLTILSCSENNKHISDISYILHDFIYLFFGTSCVNRVSKLHHFKKWHFLASTSSSVAGLSKIFYCMKIFF